MPATATRPLARYRDEPPETFPKGRRCSSCRCFLSVTNPDRLCRPCGGDPLELDELRTQKSRETFLDAIREVMEA